MATRGRWWAVPALAVAGVVASAGPAGAHALTFRIDPPLPLWLFASSRFEHSIEGWPLPAALQALVPVGAAVLRIVGLGAFAVVLVSGLLGADNPDTNIAPWLVYVHCWVGLTLVSALVGDVWRVLSPFDTLCAIGQRLRRLAGRPQPEDPAEGLPDYGYWPAAVFLAWFVWLELVYPEAGLPRTVASAMGVYTVAVLAGAATWGRAWLREGEAFAAFFGLLARMAPLYQGEDGRLRLRPPLTGLAGIQPRPGMAAVVLIALGSTTFDGVTRTRFWQEVVAGQQGGELQLTGTVGLAATVGLVAIFYFGSMRLAALITGRDTETLSTSFVHSLVPIAFAYSVAHYFSYLVYDGQRLFNLGSDPLGRGWDLFGTADWVVNLSVVSTTTIAWVQAGAIVVGHVSGVVVAHDRAVARFDQTVATRTQYPLLAVMVLYTVGGLALLLGS
jgi:hypothetical protein